MDFKKIKKGANLSGIVLSIILAIGIFMGMYLWLNYNATNSGITIDSQYQDTYNILNGSSMSKLSNNVDAIKASINNVTEAPNGFIAAINGFKGLGQTLLLPINFMFVALDTFDVMLGVTDIIPKWVKTLGVIAITAIIIFLVIAIMKGEQQKM